MSRSIVEKYEQMLSDDPGSTVFVELARAYLERGDNDAAATTCEQGIGHHPNSVVGRVLWGKALINKGKAAEAMKQFDLAVSIDRDNPHAYNLISEALLRKGLFRSALPILRKAAALQPNDGRIAQWLEQTRTALSGGPAPVLYDSTTVASSIDELAPPPAPSPPALTDDGSLPAPLPPPPPDDVFAAFGLPRADEEGDPTVLMSAYTPAVAPLSEARPPPPVSTSELPVLSATLDEERHTLELPVPAVAADAEPPVIEGEVLPPDPFALVPSRADEPGDDTIRGLTSTFDALSHGALPEIPHAAGPQPSAPPPPPVEATAEPSVIPSADLLPPQAAPAPSGGLLEDVVSVQSELPTSEYTLSGPVEAPPQMAPRASAPRADGSAALLEDIPDVEPASVFDPASSVEVPRVEFNTQATEAIAREYERELREKLDVARRKKGFFQKHGVKLVVGLVLLVVVGGLAGSFFVTSRSFQGETLQSALGKGIAGIGADTAAQYDAALESLDQALAMERGNVDALALQGYAQALLYAEHGRGDAARQAAIERFAASGVREAHPELAVVADSLIATGDDAAAAKQRLLTSDLDRSVVHAQAGRLLLADKKYDEALERLKRAVDGADTSKLAHVRALVALGDYYLAFEDWDNALAMFSRAEPLSKLHPQRILGQAQARIELGRELPEALTELEGLGAGGALPEALAGRANLLLGRALSANGRHDEALATLKAGQAAGGAALAFDYAMAVGRALQAAGQMAAAQASFEDALKRQPQSEDAKEGLGRVLLARGREKELLDRLKPERNARKVALLRGIAAWRLGDMKRARSELAGTQVSGKYPSEAVVYLALADASEGQADKALGILEKLATGTRRNRATVQVALARVYLQRNQLDKAKAQLEEAAKDPADYEGNALLGELLLNAGLPPEVAIEPLQRAVERNGSHALARHLLTRAFLAMGRVDDAVAQVEAWTRDNPSSEDAWRDAALAYLQAGRLADAATAAGKVPQSSTDVEGWRVRARILFARGDSRGAMGALQRANKLDPHDAPTFCEIGDAFVRQGNEAAVEAYKTALRESPGVACGIAGPLHAKPTGRGRAVETLTGLIVKASTAWDKAFLQGTLARVYLAERRQKEAAVAAADATQTMPTSPVAWFAAGEVARAAKDGPHTLEAYQKAVEFDGSWVAARLAWADALAQAGGASLPTALEQYEALLGAEQGGGIDQARVKKSIAAVKKRLEK